MTRSKFPPMRRTLRALALMLGYPDGERRALMPALVQAVADEGALGAARLAELRALADRLQRDEGYDVEARFVQTFDRGRATSLHLFEHVHGDSRERGPAMLDLVKTFEEAGLQLGEGELPDHLSVVLEFASTQPPEVAAGFLSEFAHILQAVFSALVERHSPYASVLAAVVELAGHEAVAVTVTPDAALDEAWEEPPAFDGCETKGQNRPTQPQPIQIVRKAKPSASQGASA